MKTPTMLYKVTANSSIQVWWQEQDGARYRTCSGKLHGEITESEWTVCKGKNIGRSNETTPEAQAAAEVTANYTLKRKSGYRESEDSARGSDHFRPMLARKFDEFDPEVLFSNGPLISQPKLDGIRCFSRDTGLYSRQGNKIVSCPHIEQQLVDFHHQNPGLVLDGELYAHQFADNFNMIVSLVRKTKLTEADLINSAANIQYTLFDVVGLPGGLWYPDRWFFLQQLVRDNIQVIHTEEASTLEELNGFYEDYLDAGYEGQMVRLPGSPYENKRSKFLLKRKEFEDAEFTIVSIEEGAGNRSGMAGYCVLELGDRTFKANIKGDRDFLRKLLRTRDSFVGGQATIEFFKPTPDGVPRFPRAKAFYTEKGSRPL